MTTSGLTLKHFAPQYWPTWLGLLLLRIIAYLPYTWQLVMGRMLGRLFYVFARSRKHIAAVNLKLCFPQLTAAERKALLYKNFLSAGMGMVELGMGWWTPTKRLLPLIHFEGLEHLQTALAAQHPVILIGAHFTTLDLAGYLLSLKIPLAVFYRYNKNPAFEFVLRQGRKRIFKSSIARDNLRAFVKTVKSGLPVWYAPDQDYGRKHSVFAPFFGVPACTITATARFASLSGAQLIPFYHYRLPNAQGYVLKFLPPLQNYPSGDDVRDATYINKIIEQGILLHPEQYIWQHRRFKTRPPGEKRPY